MNPDGDTVSDFAAGDAKTAPQLGQAAALLATCLPQEMQGTSELDWLEEVKPLSTLVNDD